VGWLRKTSGSFGFSKLTGGEDPESRFQGGVQFILGKNPVADPVGSRNSKALETKRLPGNHEFRLSSENGQIVQKNWKKMLAFTSAHGV
jgi:hypothetical protein